MYIYQQKLRLIKLLVHARTDTRTDIHNFLLSCLIAANNSSIMGKLVLRSHILYIKSRISSCCFVILNCFNEWEPDECVALAAVEQCSSRHLFTREAARVSGASPASCRYQVTTLL